MARAAPRLPSSEPAPSRRRWRPSIVWLNTGRLGSAPLTFAARHASAVAFFDLESGLKLALWPRDSIAHDSGVVKTPPGATDFTLGHNVRTREDVDRVMAQAQAAGARIVKRAVETFWGGYAGYFQDPDGHLWEIVWNPQLLPRD